MGELFLDAYAVTATVFSRAARKAADALVYGQHPGRMHYVIDFDRPGLASWYETMFSKFKWGMEEYATTGATAPTMMTTPRVRQDSCSTFT
jgi:hypothetical protein